MLCKLLSGLLIVVFCIGNEVDAADQNYLRKTITNYFSDTRHEIANATYKRRAREFIHSEFRRFGLETDYHEFTTVSQQGSFFNVIGVLKGDLFGKAADKIVAVAAHYDTVDTTKGVDDNGSGMAALLETAQQITQQNKAGVRRNNTVMFAAFDLEEYGLTGSKEFITGWLNPWLVRNYGQAARQIRPYGVIVLETMMEWNSSSSSQQIPGDATQFQMVFPDVYHDISSDNRRGDFLATIYRNSSITGDDQLANTFEEQWMLQQRPQYEIELLALPDIYTEHPAAFRDFLRSDHANFWEDNIPAIMLTDSANFRGDMIQCYHQACDNLDTMLTDDNVNFLGKTTDTIVATVDKLSHRNANNQSSKADIGRSNMVAIVVMFTLSLILQM